MADQSFWSAYDEVEDFRRKLRQDLINFLQRVFPVPRAEVEAIKALGATLIHERWKSNRLQETERKLALACYEQLRSLVKSALVSGTDPTACFNALELVVRGPMQEDLVLALQNNKYWPNNLPDLSEEAEERLNNLATQEGCRRGARKWLFANRTLAVQDLDPGEVEEMLEIVQPEDDRRKELRERAAALSADRLIAQFGSQGGPQ